MKYYFTNHITQQTSCNLMDVVSDPLNINMNYVFGGCPLFCGKTAYPNVTYRKRENEDFYIKLTENNIKGLLTERINILQKIYRKEDTAVLLSGGIDSSVVASLWKPAEVWSLDNSNIRNLDETFYSSLMAAKLNAKINFVKPEFDSTHLRAMIAENGTLSRHAGFFALDTLLKSIKKAGYKHVLVGSHADYCFGHFKIGFVLELLKLIDTNPVFTNYSQMCKRAIGTPEEILLKLIGVSSDIDCINNYKNDDNFIANRLHNIMSVFDDQEQYNECFLSNFYGLDLIDPFKSKYIEDFAFKYNKENDYENGNPKKLLKQEFQSEIPQEILNRQHKIGCSVPYWEWFPEVTSGNYKNLIKLFFKWHCSYWSNKNHSFYYKDKIKNNILKSLANTFETELQDC